MVSLDSSSKKRVRTFDSSRPDSTISNGDRNLQYPFILHKNFEFFAKRRRNKFIIPLQYDQDHDKEKMLDFDISIQIPINGILLRNSILAYFCQSPIPKK